MKSLYQYITEKLDNVTINDIKQLAKSLKMKFDKFIDDKGYETCVIYKVSKKSDFENLEKEFREIYQHNKNGELSKSFDMKQPKFMYVNMAIEKEMYPYRRISKIFDKNQGDDKIIGMLLIRLQNTNGIINRKENTKQSTKDTTNNNKIQQSDAEVKKTLSYIKSILEEPYTVKYINGKRTSDTNTYYAYVICDGDSLTDQLGTLKITNSNDTYKLTYTAIMSGQTSVGCKSYFDLQDAIKDAINFIIG